MDPQMIQQLMMRAQQGDPQAIQMLEQLGLGGGGGPPPGAGGMPPPGRPPQGAPPSMQGGMPPGGMGVQPGGMGMPPPRGDGGPQQAQITAQLLRGRGA
jgi:hypothetical protein